MTKATTEPDQHLYTPKTFFHARGAGSFLLLVTEGGNEGTTIFAQEVSRSLPQRPHPSIHPSSSAMSYIAECLCKAVKVELTGEPGWWYVASLE